MMAQGIYSAIMESLFFAKYEEGTTEIIFSREEIVEHAIKINQRVPKNLGDLVYSFRYRATMPESITATAPDNYSWVIIGVGDAKYKFVLSRNTNIVPNANLRPVLIPNNTPEILSVYSLSDEQSLLSMVRYNRVIDLFLGIVAYSMQNHLRTKVEEIGQIEIDELYIGVNKIGQHFVMPVQAKVGNDKIGVVQLYQDIAFCKQRFPDLICIPIAVHFQEQTNSICLFRLALDGYSVQVVEEKHYKLVSGTAINDDYIRWANREQNPMLLE